jgi:hypothetical protein
MPLDSAGSSDFLSDSDSSTSSINSSEEKIPKPAGEPGRPGRGGYTLHEALEWNPKAYTKFKVREVYRHQHCKSNSQTPKKHMHQLIQDHLDTTKCASAQSPVLLKVVRNKVNGLHQSRYCQ